MANVPMPQVLRRWGLLLLGASSEEIVPGVVLDRRTFQRIAYLKNLLEGSEDLWPTQLIDGHIPDVVQWERSLRGRASLVIPGVIAIRGGLGPATGGRFSISQVATRVLRSQYLDDVRLQVRLEEWAQERSNRRYHRRIRRNLFVESTWYAQEYTLELLGTRGADLEAEVAENINVGAGASAEWASGTTVRVTGNTRVPFAVRRWVIR
jgi:hypothetical protein